MLFKGPDGDPNTPKAGRSQRPCSLSSLNAFPEIRGSFNEKREYSMSGARASHYPSEVSRLLGKCHRIHSAGILTCFPFAPTLPRYPLIDLRLSGEAAGLTGFPPGAKDRLTREQLMLSRNPAPLQNSRLSLEYLLLPPRSAAAAAPAGAQALPSSRPRRPPTQPSASTLAGSV